MLSAQIVLTPTESKRLLSRTILKMDSVKRALDSGILIIHPSSTTIFMLDELGFKLSPKGIWICGHWNGVCVAFHSAYCSRRPGYFEFRHCDGLKPVFQNTGENGWGGIMRGLFDYPVGNIHGYFIEFRSAERFASIDNISNRAED